MNRTKMTPGEDPDEFLYIMDSGRNRLSTSTPTEGPTDRQYEDILLQALPPDYESIRKAHLERRDFGLADNRRMMAAIYADNLSHRSITPVGIARPGAAMKARDSDLNDVQCHKCSMFGRYRKNCPNRRKQQYQGGQHQHPMDDSARTVGSKRRIEVGDEVFVVHITKPPPIECFYDTHASDGFKTDSVPFLPVHVDVIVNASLSCILFQLGRL